MELLDKQNGIAINTLNKIINFGQMISVSSQISLRIFYFSSSQLFIAKIYNHGEAFDNIRSKLVYLQAKIAALLALNVVKTLMCPVSCFKMNDMNGKDLQMNPT